MNRWKIKLIKISELFNLSYSRSFSQEGEDMLMKELFFKKKKGFYIDVGAHHPKRFSNTYYYYRQGWKGINIDAMPGSMRLFNFFRRRDTNLELGIADKEGELTYYVFGETALNTFSKEIADERRNKYKLKKQIKVKVYPLSGVLDKYAPANIDFLSIDIEGMDLLVLKTVDWNKYKPKVVLVETGVIDRYNPSNEISSFLETKGYSFYACSSRTSLFLYHG
ncbi:FkbM family methyltransferase [Maribellus comscasis]|uniref:FkbM family methyltransferase n=1 Tax=Maribellus comscasis TaxID=2681766 RepID=A0A6I6JZ59_9BACT|nr:FkbM family methyltransferase [Maribellus comscasis]QGY44443.1 FkbM family methyltransferase [Maribellus comscasis]